MRVWDEIYTTYCDSRLLPLDRQTDRQTERQASRQTDRQTDRQIYRPIDGQIDRQTNTHTNRQTNRVDRKNRQTDSQLILLGSTLGYGNGASHRLDKQSLQYA